MFSQIGRNWQLRLEEMRRPRSITEVGLVLFATVHIQTHTVYTQQHLEQWALEAAPEEVVTFLVLPHYTSARGKKLQFPEARLSRFSQVKKKRWMYGKNVGDGVDRQESPEKIHGHSGTKTILFARLDDWPAVTATAITLVTQGGHIFLNIVCNFWHGINQTFQYSIVLL